MDISAIILFATLFIVALLFIYDYKKISRELKAKEDKYNVSKYPITSQMGKQYYAEIKYKYDTFQGDLIWCYIFKREVKRKNGKYKDILITSEQINFQNFDYNYIDVVSHCVEEYERINREELESKKYEEETVKKNKEAFGNWDGVIEN